MRKHQGSIKPVRHTGNCVRDLIDEAARRPMDLKAGRRHGRVTCVGGKGPRGFVVNDLQLVLVEEKESILQDQLMAGYGGI